MADAASTPRSIPVRNPRTGEMDYTFKALGTEEMAAEITALRAAQPEWESMGVKGRNRVLGKWQAVLEKNRAEIVAALSIDTGRKMIAQVEYMGLMQSITRWRQLALTMEPLQPRHSTEHDDIILNNRTEPYPIAGIISPWNFPLLLSFIDALPALMAGCATYIKPSEVTPRFAEPLNRSIAAVPELEAILRVIPGDGACGAALIPLVDVVAFTGSVKTGRKVNEATARAFIPAFLELGGKDPAIVLADADIDHATTALLRGSISATGQACQSIERIYVEGPVLEAFVTQLVAKAEAVKLSWPDASSGDIGPLIFERQAKTIARHLQDAQDKGAKILTCGEILDHDGGLWIRPTVLTNVDHSMDIMRQETFGPIMPVMPFQNDDEAIALANDSVYGLSGCVFSGDEARAVHIAERMDVGAVSINDAALTSKVHEIENEPRRFSGAGPSRMGITGLKRFLQSKALLINRGAATPIQAFAEKG